jgi:ubiquinone/menaquinone biosynthesis C-methylase UbiE
MAKLSLIRRLLTLGHHETTHWFGTIFYNSVSATDVFQRHYDILAKDILSYCSRGRLLDIGTGPARLLIKLCRQSSKMRFAGIDPSQPMLTRARRHIEEAGMKEFIEVKQGISSQIPFPDNSFDIVISTASIHHWKQPTAGLNEAYRVLKEGGYVLIYDVVSDAPEAVLSQARREFGKLATLLFWLHSFDEPFYSQKDLESLAGATLFKGGRSRFVGLLHCLILKKEPEK